MMRGYNPRCVKGSEEARQKAELTRVAIEEAKAEAEMNSYIDSCERSAKNYWDSVIEW